MKTKQTAVEWLINKVEEHFCLLPVDLIEQAKAMEKEQIKDVFDEARLTNPILGFKHVTFEQYYNETYEQ